MAFLAQSGDVDRHQQWLRFYEAVISPFNQYRVPTIELSRSTPKEAVCQVFEKVNTGGVSLTVFELLTATYAADDFRLTDDWETRRKLFADYDVLSAFPAADFLQIVTLLSTRERSSGSREGRVSAISCKRRDMLRLELDDYRRWADDATEALRRVVRFLHAERIFEARFLPYSSQLVLLTAIITVLGDRADSQPRAARRSGPRLPAHGLGLPDVRQEVRDPSRR